MAPLCPKCDSTEFTSTVKAIGAAGQVHLVCCKHCSTAIGVVPKLDDIKSQLQQLESTVRSVKSKIA